MGQGKKIKFAERTGRLLVDGFQLVALFVIGASKFSMASEPRVTEH